jgi:hypothetical protein
MKGGTVDALIEQLWPDGDAANGRQVFAVVDGARDPRIQAMLRDSGLEQLCLFAGPLTPALEAVAPRLVRMSPQARLTRPLFECGWNDHWFVLVRTAPDVTLQQLHRHLRTLLRVRDEAGRILMFRFYDPRVLRPYLPTCTSEEGRLMFGPIEEFVCADDVADGMITFGQVPAGVCSLKFTGAFDALSRNGTCA